LAQTFNGTRDSVTTAGVFITTAAVIKKVTNKQNCNEP